MFMLDEIIIANILHVRGLEPRNIAFAFLLLYKIANYVLCFSIMD